MKEITLKESQAVPSYSRPIRTRVNDILDYTLIEMKTQIDFDLPVATK